MKNSIKALAKEAKHRMRVSGAPEDRSTLADITAEEERIYRIVCKMQESGGIVTDPIMQVADPNVWKKVSGVAKERYVLNLSQTYLKQLARYRAEKA